MHLARLQRPLQRAAAGLVLRTSTTTITATASTTARLEEGFASLRIAPSPIAANAAAAGRRYASVKSQGAYRLKSKKTIPKKMGAKKTGDQYVIPGNIIYKQRGTIWHPGENAIMGRDHTIHAAVAGYVKYYRDPLRHPKRQYIGVVFNRDDKLPYPVGTPRRRKLALTAVIRKVKAPVEETTSASGIPLSVTRHDPVVKTTEKEKLPAAPEKAAVESAAPVPLRDGNSVLASLLNDKIRNRKIGQAKREAQELAREEELEARKATRVFRLQSDYSYRESNWEIGRLVGDAGSIPGTEKTGSRRIKFRARRSRRMAYLHGIKERKLAKVVRRAEYGKLVRAKRERTALERSKVAAAAKATEAAASAAAAKAKAKKGDKENKVKA